MYCEHYWIVQLLMSDWYIEVLRNNFAMRLIIPKVVDVSKHLLEIWLGYRFLMIHHWRAKNNFTKNVFWKLNGCLLYGNTYELVTILWQTKYVYSYRIGSFWYIIVDRFFNHNFFRISFDFYILSKFLQE